MHRPEVIKKNEWPDHAVVQRWQQTPYRKIAEIAAVRIEYCDDLVRHVARQAVDSRCEEYLTPNDTIRILFASHRRDRGRNIGDLPNNKFAGDPTMLDTPVIIQTTALLTAIIPIKVVRSDMQKIMGPGINEVIATVKAQGIGPTGPWFANHSQITAEEFDFEICVPVSVPVAAAGGVRQGQRPAMKVAQTIYSGPCEVHGAAWSEFGVWIAAPGFSPATNFSERYIVSPESNTNSTTYRTELN